MDDDSGGTPANDFVGTLENQITSIARRARRLAVVAQTLDDAGEDSLLRMEDVKAEYNRALHRSSVAAAKMQELRESLTYEQFNMFAQGRIAVSEADFQLFCDYVAHILS